TAPSVRSVRAVGWCSIVTLPPASHTPWAPAATNSGSTARIATALPGGTAVSDNAPATLRARWCTTAQLRRVGSSGTPVTMPQRAPATPVALCTILSTKLLMRVSLRRNIGQDPAKRETAGATRSGGPLLHQFRSLQPLLLDLVLLGEYLLELGIQSCEAFRLGRGLRELVVQLPLPLFESRQPPLQLRQPFAGGSPLCRGCFTRTLAAARAGRCRLLHLPSALQILVDSPGKMGDVAVTEQRVNAVADAFDEITVV